MEENSKQLLLKDLCGRLPYGVNVKTTGDNESYTLLSINWNKNIALIGLKFGDVYATSKIKIDEVKPYIRPMSSMTEEERKEYAKLLFDDLGGVYEDYYKALDYLHSIHVDYRGLIPKGLALEAPDGMYGKEEQQ